MHFLMTSDVESFSIHVNRCDPETAAKVYREGLPKLLSLYSKYDVASTFYFTGELAETVPEAIDLVKENGHEIGCHGYSHEVGDAFDLIGFDEQVRVLESAKKVIEKNAGRIESFRAPALRINRDTIRALDKTGFSSDSSVCPQRFDGPFTFGSKKKLAWLVSKRKPFVYADSGVAEIPISALLLPYIGTTMRISPSTNKLLGKVHYAESRRTDKPVVFLFHPNECLEDSRRATPRRTKNFVQHIFADRLRQKMKMKNLGPSSLKLLEQVIVRAKGSGFEFVRVKDYRKTIPEAAQ